MGMQLADEIAKGLISHEIKYNIKSYQSAVTVQIKPIEIS